MLAALTAPYVDVRAADLVLELDAPRAPALDVLVLDFEPGLRLELRLLGHSHQAIVSGRGLALSEKVSCRPGGDADLPGARHELRGAYAYTFGAQLLALDAADGDALTDEVAADPHGLVGVFAGQAGAFTALRGAAITEPGAAGLRWETWHAYPQTGELVRTTGELRRP